MAGKSFHLAPVLRIQRIPSRHSRSSAGGRPPLGFLRRLGSNGSIFLHCSSVNIGTRTLIGLPPKSDVRELNRHYTHLVHPRYRRLQASEGFATTSSKINQARIYSCRAPANGRPRRSSLPEGILSLTVAAERFYEVCGKEAVVLKKEPIPRFVIQIPLVPKFWDFFRERKLFGEEIMALRETCKKLFTQLTELEVFKVHGNLTLMDLVIVHRVFNFFRFVMMKHASNILLESPEIVIRSLLPVFRYSSLLELLEMCLPTDKAQSFIELMSWDYQSEKILDLQYPANRERARMLSGSVQYTRWIKCH